MVRDIKSQSNEGMEVFSFSLIFGHANFERVVSGLVALSSLGNIMIVMFVARRGKNFFQAR